MLQKICPHYEDISYSWQGNHSIFLLHTPISYGFLGYGTIVMGYNFPEYSDAVENPWKHLGLRSHLNCRGQGKGKPLIKGKQLNAVPVCHYKIIVKF